MNNLSFASYGFNFRASSSLGSGVGRLNNIHQNDIQLIKKMLHSAYCCIIFIFMLIIIMLSVVLLNVVASLRVTSRVEDLDL